MKPTKNVYFALNLALLAVAFLAFTALNNSFVGSARFDLTENRLYTLSDGTRQIIDNIDEPINLYFFFSDQASEDLTSLRVYAKRVEELLAEYALYGGDRINLRVIDPAPFSEQEDRAAAFGLQGVPIDSETDLYLGLAATNALDDRGVIPFFQPGKEEFLEYEISKLIHGLTETDPPYVGLMSSLPVQGTMNPQTFEQTRPWIAVEQMRQLYDVQNIDTDATSFPDDMELLILIHPKDLSEDTLFAIDQFVMSGGRLLAFVDPLAEMDQGGRQNPLMGHMPAEGSSDLNRLFAKWGVTLRDGTVLADAQAALQVGSGRSGAPVRHLGILGMRDENLSDDDVVTAELDSVIFATAGILDVSDEAAAKVTPLIESSPYSMPLEVFRFHALTDPAELQSGFEPTGEKYLVAARLSGRVSSAFPQGIEGFDGEVRTETENLNAIVIADTDVLSDRLWVRVQDFFGQQISEPWANNGDLITNAVENLVGNSALISIRSRGRFSRPFERVQNLRREAEARYARSANDLQAQLTETERKLRQLQETRTEQNLLSLGPEQEAALERFQEEKLRIRKQLREVRHQLDKDISSLGATLKFINIILAPVLLTLGLLFFNYLRVARKRSR